MVELPSGSYVLDAYFIDKITYLPRKSLMIYPTSIIPKRKWSTQLHQGRIIESNLSVHEVYKILVNTYLELKRKLHEDIKRVIRKSKFIILMPMPRSMLGEVDREVRNALIILDKVFEKCTLKSEVDMRSWHRVYVEVDIKVKGDEIHVKAPNPIPKIYRWLYLVDEGFNKAMNELLRR